MAGESLARLYEQAAYLGEQIFRLLDSAPAGHLDTDRLHELITARDAVLTAADERLAQTPPGVGRQGLIPLVQALLTQTAELGHRLGQARAEVARDLAAALSRARLVSGTQQILAPGGDGSLNRQA